MCARSRSSAVRPRGPPRDRSPSRAGRAGAPAGALGRSRRRRRTDQVDVEASQQRRERGVTQRMWVERDCFSSWSIERFVVHQSSIPSSRTSALSLNTTHSRPWIFPAGRIGIVEGLSGSSGGRSCDHAVRTCAGHADAGEPERQRHPQGGCCNREQSGRRSRSGRAAEAVVGDALTGVAEGDGRSYLCHRVFLGGLRPGAAASRTLRLVAATRSMAARTSWLGAEAQEKRASRGRIT